MPQEGHAAAGGEGQLLLQAWFNALQAGSEAPPATKTLADLGLTPPTEAVLDDWITASPTGTRLATR